MARPAYKGPMYSREEAFQMLKNMGHDVTCNACMAVAFTGAGLPGDQHTCQQLVEPSNVELSWIEYEGIRDRAPETERDDAGRRALYSRGLSDGRQHRR